MRAPFLIIFVAAQEISPILFFMAKPDLKPIFTVVALTILFILNPTYAFSKDITKQVINETPLDEQITFFCLMYCIGNEAPVPQPISSTSAPGRRATAAASASCSFDTRPRVSQRMPAS